MTDDERLVIAIAFPIAEAQRAIVQLLTPENPLPTLQRPGSVVKDCVVCGMHLDVGPKLATMATPVYCPVCGIALAQEIAERGIPVNLADVTDLPDGFVP